MTVIMAEHPINTCIHIFCLRCNIRKFQLYKNIGKKVNLVSIHA